MNYSELAFTDAVKKLQERLGSRLSYERMEKRSYVDGLTAQEEEVIARIDSFYIASFGENGFPYLRRKHSKNKQLILWKLKKVGV